MAGACICVPVAEVKAEDGYNIDSYDNDDDIYYKTDHHLSLIHISMVSFA